MECAVHQGSIIHEWSFRAGNVWSLVFEAVQGSGCFLSVYFGAADGCCAVRSGRCLHVLCVQCTHFFERVTPRGPPCVKYKLSTVVSVMTS